MTRRIITLAIIMTLLLAGAAMARTPEVDNGLGYLTGVQNPDGSWGDDGSSAPEVPSTVASIDALTVLGETGTVEHAMGTAWLSGLPLETTDYMSERMLVLAAPGADRDVLLSYIDAMIPAWGGYEGYDVNNLDTALALDALASIDHPDLTTIQYALAYIFSTQNADGGWGFSEAISS